MGFSLVKWVNIVIKVKVKWFALTKIIIAKPEGLDLYKAVISPIFAFIFLFYVLRMMLILFLIRRDRAYSIWSTLIRRYYFLFKCGCFFVLR